MISKLFGRPTKPIKDWEINVVKEAYEKHKLIAFDLDKRKRLGKRAKEKDGACYKKWQEDRVVNRSSYAYGHGAYDGYYFVRALIDKYIYHFLDKHDSMIVDDCHDLFKRIRVFFGLEKYKYMAL